jgi:hypothetical protein
MINAADDQETPESALRARALALYKGPFNYHHGYIYDAAGQMISDEGRDAELKGLARVRGWGRISSLPEAGELQDQVGELIAEALTKFWEANQ